MHAKKQLSERDICTKYITPALQSAGWDIDKQILEEVSFTDGKIFVRGKLTARGKRKRADYILYYNSNPIAIIEAKDNNNSVNAGIRQVLDNGESWIFHLYFGSNGAGFLFHDFMTKLQLMIREKRTGVDQFPLPDALWSL